MRGEIPRGGGGGSRDFRSDPRRRQEDQEPLTPLGEEIDKDGVYDTTKEAILLKDEPDELPDLTHLAEEVPLSFRDIQHEMSRQTPRRDLTPKKAKIPLTERLDNIRTAPVSVPRSVRPPLPLELRTADIEEEAKRQHAKTLSTLTEKAKKHALQAERDKTRSTDLFFHLGEMFQDLGIEFDVTINADGSIPRGGILGRNKRQFEKLMNNNAEFRKRYESMMKKKEPLMQKTPGRAGFGLTAAAVVGGMLGSAGLEKKFESDVNRGWGEATKSDRFTREPEPMDARGEFLVHTMPETRMRAQGVRLELGIPFEASYLSRLQKLAPGQNEAVALGQFTKLKLFKDVRGTMYALIQDMGASGATVRGARIDEKGIVHPLTQTEIRTTELNSHITSFEQARVGDQTQLPRQPFAKEVSRPLARELKTASIDSELPDLTDDAELIEEDEEVTRVPVARRTGTETKKTARAGKDVKVVSRIKSGDKTVVTLDRPSGMSDEEFQIAKKAEVKRVTGQMQREDYGRTILAKDKIEKISSTARTRVKMMQEIEGRLRSGKGLPNDKEALRALMQEK